MKIYTFPSLYVWLTFSFAFTQLDLDTSDGKGNIFSSKNIQTVKGLKRKHGGEKRDEARRRWMEGWGGLVNSPRSCVANYLVCFLRTAPTH